MIDQKQERQYQMKRMFLFYVFLMTIFLLNASEISSGSTYKITSVFSKNKSLSVRNSSLDNKVDVVTWTETNVNAQKWRFDLANDKFFFISNAYTGKSLHYSSMRPKPGDRIEQDANDNSAYFQWEFVPVNNKAYPNTYFIRFSLKSSENYLYLEQLDDVDGSNVKAQLKSTGIDSLRQMWKIEAVNAALNSVTPELREEMMNGWKDYYYKQASVGHVLGDGGWWGDAEMFETVLDAFETTGDVKYKEMFNELYINFVYRNKTDWTYNEYNDDIAWMVITAVRAYLMFDDGRYLNHAQSNFDKMYARALLPSGMLRWKENPQNNMGTNSCINGPAEVAACYLALATGNDAYYQKAKKLYELQRQYLYDSSTGKVFDSGVWNNGTFSIQNYWVSTYNQGTFLGAALMLYNRYGDEMYKNDAHKVVEWTRKDLCDANGVIKVCGSGNDLQGFKGILMRYLRRYIVDLAQEDDVNWMQRNAVHAFNNRNSKRISWTGWWEKTTENFIFSDGYNYVNQPFGASTAVSAAYNAPLDRNLIIKDAYRPIEAEHFDYLKGILVEKKSNDENEQVVSNIFNNYYTAYCNVDFGIEQAKTASFTVLGASSGGSIEIHSGSPSGLLLGTATVPSDVSGNFISTSCDLNSNFIGGMQKIYLVYKGGGFKVDNFCFYKSGTGLENSKVSTRIKLYPNPASSELFIKTPESGNVLIQDSLGRMIYSFQIQEGITNLDVKNYNTGVYFLNFLTNEKKVCASFIKN